MDRAILERHLVAAEQRTLRGERQVERQRETVDLLRRLGRDSVKAEALLVAFEQAQTIRLAHIDRLRIQLRAVLQYRKPVDSHQKV